MKSIDQIINYVLESSASESRSILQGKQALLSNLFEFLLSKSSYPMEENPTLLFFNKKGVILNCITPTVSGELKGYHIPDKLLINLMDKFSTVKVADDYYLAAFPNSGYDSYISTLKNDLEKILEVFDKSTEDLQYLIDCLDFLELPIAIYGSDGPTLLYWNKSYRKLMNIEDNTDYTGMDASDIFRELGVKFRFTTGQPNRWRMYDVLNTGKKITETDMYIEPNAPSDETSLVSYNIYPVKDNMGNISGTAEFLLHSKLNMNKITKLVSTNTDYTFDSIIHTSSAMENCIQQAKQFANSRYNVLVTGESGVGKELFSQAIHNYSDRSNGPFVALNCANFPENLIESELFGYVGGAFTGASKKRTDR